MNKPIISLKDQFIDYIKTLSNRLSASFVYEELPDKLLVYIEYAQHDKLILILFSTSLEEAKALCIATGETFDLTEESNKLFETLDQALNFRIKLEDELAYLQSLGSINDTIKNRIQYIKRLLNFKP